MSVPRPTEVGVGRNEIVAISAALNALAAHPAEGGPNAGRSRRSRATSSGA